MISLSNPNAVLFVTFGGFDSVNLFREAVSCVIHFYLLFIFFYFFWYEIYTLYSAECWILLHFVTLFNLEIYSDKLLEDKFELLNVYL